jgi:hypothetical protein
LLSVAVDPSREGHEQQPQVREVGHHRPSLPQRCPACAQGGRVFGHYALETGTTVYVLDVGVFAPATTEGFTARDKERATDKNPKLPLTYTGGGALRLAPRSPIR